MKLIIKIFIIGSFLAGGFVHADSILFSDLATFDKNVRLRVINLKTVDAKTLEDLVTRAATFDIVNEDNSRELEKIAPYRVIRTLIENELERRNKEPKEKLMLPTKPVEMKGVPKEDFSKDLILNRMRVWDKKFKKDPSLIADLPIDKITMLADGIIWYENEYRFDQKSLDRLNEYVSVKKAILSEYKLRVNGPEKVLPLRRLGDEKSMGVHLLTDALVKKDGLNNLFGRLEFKSPDEQMVYVRNYGLAGTLKVVGVSYADAVSFPQVANARKFNTSATWADDAIVAQLPVADQFALVGAYASCPALALYTSFQIMAFAHYGDDKYLKDLINKGKAKAFFDVTGKLQAAEFDSIEALYAKLAKGNFSKNGYPGEIFKNYITLIQSVGLFDPAKQKIAAAFFGQEPVDKIEQVKKDLRTKDSCAHAFVIFTSQDESVFRADGSQHYFTFAVLKADGKIQYLVLDSMPNFYHLAAKSFMFERVQYMIQCLEGKKPTVSVIRAY